MVTTPATIIPCSTPDSSPERARSWSRSYWIVPMAVLLGGATLAWLLVGSPVAHPDWSTWTTLTPAARSALAHLRRADNFGWYVVPLLVLVLYVYSVEIERRHWNQVFAGLALFGMDWFNELCNGLVLHVTRTSAVWVTPGHSALILLPGWTIEIAFMFAISGIVFANLLLPDRHRRVGLVPNRWAWALGMSLFAVLVEVLLNRADALVWHWPWWNWPNIGLIILLGYLHFFIVAFLVYDMVSIPKKAAVVATIYSIDVALTLVFVVALGWM